MISSYRITLVIFTYQAQVHLYTNILILDSFQGQNKYKVGVDIYLRSKH
jgi:hypothetical protein